MKQTKPELYRVHKINGKYMWLEVFEGKDEGLRVSVPAISTDYSDEIISEIENFKVNDVYRLTLVSESNDPPHWKIKKVHKHLINLGI